jgi:hypothetical protein
MNDRKWPVLSVLWLTASVLIFVVSVSWDVYHHVAQSKFFGVSTVARDLMDAVCVGWWFTLPGDAKRTGGFVWLGGSLLSFIGIGCYETAKTVHLSSLTDTQLTYAGELLPLLVAVGVVLLGRQRERLEEIQTVR